MNSAYIKVTVTDTCDSCPYVYYGQYCVKCKATKEWKDIPVTIEDVPGKCIRPHYIPDWCPFLNNDGGK